MHVFLIIEGYYLHSFLASNGLTVAIVPQSPSAKCYPRNPEKIKKWLTDNLAVVRLKEFNADKEKEAQEAVAIITVEAPAKKTELPSV